MKPPERGDLVWIDFDPQSGHEQAGRRPALVLTPYAYNRASGLAIVCPVTRQAAIICHAPDELVEDATAKLHALTGGEE